MVPIYYDVVVIGGGISGLITSITARKNHAGKVLLIEREDRIGGIVSFLSGYVKIEDRFDPRAYIASLLTEAVDMGVEVLMNTSIIAMDLEKNLKLLNQTAGIIEVYGNTVVFATGRYESTRAMQNILGSRPAGVYSAQLVLKWIEKGLCPGSQFVVYGDNILGLVAADQILKSSGTLVKYLTAVRTTKFDAEILSNCDQRIKENIESGIMINQVMGNERLVSIEVSKVDEHSNRVFGSKQIIPCDTLVLATEFIIDKDFFFANRFPAVMDPVTKGLVVGNSFHTTYPGFLAVGSVVKVSNSIEESIRDAELAGLYLSQFSKG
jgi:thioredoxin reductase